MEKTPKVGGNQFSNRFVDESPQNSTKPVASSTFLASKIEFDFKDLDNTFQSPKPASVSGLSTTSSLGVLDLEKQSLLFDERDVSTLCQNSEQFLKDRRSQSYLNRFSERISNIGSNQSNVTTGMTILPESSFRPSPIRESVTVVNGSEKLSAQSQSSKISYINGFSNISNMDSLVADSFESGKQAVFKFDADQKENRIAFGSLPVSPMNISFNSENIDEREKRFSECVQSKCYSVEDIGNVLRNKTVSRDEAFQLLPENISRNPLSVTEIEDMLSKRLSMRNDDLRKESKYFQRVPGQNCDLFNNFSVRNTSKQIRSILNLPKTEFQFNDTLHDDVKIVESDSTFMQNTFEESCASSIASIHEIAEALRRKSLVSDPRKAVEHLLSIGRSKPKFVPQMSPVADVKNEEAPTEIFSTPSVLKNTEVNTPSTIIGPTRELGVDPVTGKVYSDNKATSFATARHSLDEANRKLSNLDFEIPKMASKKPVKYFHIVKSSSNLDIIEACDQKNNTRGFWKLNPENSEPIDVLSCTLNNTILESTKKLQYNDSSSKANDLEPVRRVSNFHDSIYLANGDADMSCSENICAGILCIGTQVEVIIAIENPVHTPLKYQVNLKSITVDEVQNLSAASVMFVSNEPEISLLPNVENEIKITLSPLVLGKIEVQLEFISEDPNFSNIFRNVKVIGEKPKLKLLYPEVGDINYGVLIEGEYQMASLRLKNNGLARLPLKLVIHEDNGTRMMSARTVIEPSDVFNCNIRVKTSEIFNVLSNITHLEGQLDILLDTSEELALAKIINLQSIKLEAQIAKVKLLANYGQPLIIRCSPSLKTATSQMEVKNTSSIPLDISIKIQGSHSQEFSIEPKVFNVLPNNEQLLMINFVPSVKDKTREVVVKFSVAGSTKVFSCPIIGLLEREPAVTSSISSPVVVKRSNDVYLTPQSNSSSSSSTGAEGPMELDCTHYSISWGSIPIHSKNIQAMTLRNRNSQREKLLLSISDSTETFKFIENNLLHRDIKLTLEPKESRKISIQFMPFMTDHAINGKVIIMRRHLLETSVSELRRRVIPLYGIGGTAKIVFSGVFRDNDNRLWITPDSETYETKFIVENTGDCVGFVKFVSEDTDDTIVPEELILLPKESSEVHYNLYLSKDRLDLLYKQNPQKEVLLANRLLVLSGCESTRLRLRRLWFKYKEFENIQRFRDKIKILVQMTTQGNVHVDTLADNQSTLNKLWCEGVTEQSIGVVIYQQHLESACLDSTVIFKDLSDQTTLIS